MMLCMRTTVTLDPDVERLLRDAMHQRRQSFKETLNQAIRAGLSGSGGYRVEDAPFVVHARRMGLRAGIDPGRLNQLADELEAEAFLGLSRGLQHRTRSPSRRRK
jgi:hypothetical protein